MGGVKIGDDFVTSADAKQQVLDTLAKIVGYRTNSDGRRMKPDLIFAIDVIKRTVPAKMLKAGPKRDDYERAIETLFAMRDELSQVETTIDLLWHVEDA